jgi:uncharacterized membrane protein YhaH (DUF805 family)
MTIKQVQPVAAVGLVLALLNVLAVPGALPGTVRILVVLGFACVGPGAAVLAHMRIRDATVTWAMVVLISLTVTAGAATGLIWLTSWHPAAVSLVISGLVALSCMIALLAPRGSGRRFRLSHAGVP